jgi:hypothetical protein
VPPNFNTMDLIIIIKKTLQLDHRACKQTEVKNQDFMGKTNKTNKTNFFLSTLPFSHCTVSYNHTIIQSYNHTIIQSYNQIFISVSNLVYTKHLMYNYYYSINTINYY